MLEGENDLSGISGPNEHEYRWKSGHQIFETDIIIIITKIYDSFK